MKKNLITLVLIFVSCDAYALTERTHETINMTIAQRNINGFSLDTYIRNQLGFSNGINEDLIGIDANIKRAKKKVYECLGYGGEQEDRPGSVTDYLQNKETRSLNHFHNPLMPWSLAGLNDNFIGQRTGQSSVLWAQNPNQHVGGRWSWPNARRYFYIALTGYDIDGTLIAPNKSGRDRYFADTFRAVGQVMHLVHDSSVPEHVRNDIHILPAYEKYVNEIREANSLLWGSWIGSPITFDRSILNIPSTDTSAMVPISRIVDTDRYKFNNPEITTTLPGLPQAIGIAEYTNANFLSKDTMFDSDPTHHFENPQITDTVKWTDSNNRTYIRKVGSGDIVDHLAVTSVLYLYRERYFSQFNESLPVSLDVECYKDYAQKLIPRAVGYSAGLLNYFFRGDIKLEYITAPNPGYVIMNNSGEKMEGNFTIYYDNVNDERFPLWAGRGTLEATIGDKTNPFNFIPPSDAKEPGKYIVVFKGKMGNEDGAVAGYVFQRLLEITPPDQFLYSIADEDQADPYFTNIKVKVRNANTSEAIGNGVIQAVAKYKTGIDDADFSFSMSAPRSISSLAADQATEFTFDFSNDPIPVDVTDLYLQVIFRGTIGNENNAIVTGLKDISEPTPIGVFNNMDRICINGQWYVTGSQEAYDALPGDQKWWDYWPHNLENEYIKISPADASSEASPTNYTFHWPVIETGALSQEYILCDYEFTVSSYGTMAKKDPNDLATHDNVIKKVIFKGSGVRNQREYTTDPAVCSQDGLSAPCIVRRTSAFYPFRGVEMWGPGGIITDGLSYPNYTDPNYIPCAWEDLSLL